MKLTRKSTDLLIYNLLAERRMSGEEIGEVLGISRAAVWKAINKIRQNGVQIDVEGRRGYAIVEEMDVNPYKVASIAFRNLKFLDEVFYYTSVDSTNLRAREYGRPSVLFFAESQSAGRGRLGRRWESERGGLYFSLTLQPPLGFDDLSKLTLIAGLAVADSLPGAKLKWPNDVMVEGKKVCGILSEIHGELERPVVIIGIGINVSNPVPENAIRVQQFWYVDLTQVFDKVLKTFQHHYSLLVGGEWEKLRERYAEKCDTIGKVVKVITPTGEIVGRAEGIAKDGAIIIDGKKVYSGDCIHLRNYRSR